MRCRRGWYELQCAERHHRSEEPQQATLIAAVAAINTRIDNINTSTTLANLPLWAGVRGFDSTGDYSAVTTWQHIMTMGCSSILTTGTTGNPGDGCWKVRRPLHPPPLSLYPNVAPVFRS